MTDFHFDTSGAVESHTPPNNIHHTFWPDFPPLTLLLSDDGKIHLSPA